MVADIVNEGLIGRDFLRSNRNIIDFAAYEVTHDRDPVIARCKEGQERTCRVSVAKTVIVLAGTWTIIERRAMKSPVSGLWVVKPLRGKRNWKMILTPRTITHEALPGCLLKS